MQGKRKKAPESYKKPMYTTRKQCVLVEENNVYNKGGKKEDVQSVMPLLPACRPDNHTCCSLAISAYRNRGAPPRCTHHVHAYRRRVLPAAPCDTHPQQVLGISIRLRATRVFPLQQVDCSSNDSGGCTGAVAAGELPDPLAALLLVPPRLCSEKRNKAWRGGWAPLGRCVFLAGCTFQEINKQQAKALQEGAKLLYQRVLQVGLSVQALHGGGEAPLLGQ